MDSADKIKVSEHFRTVVNSFPNADRPLEGQDFVTPRMVLERSIAKGQIFTAIEDHMSKTGKTLDEILAQNKPQSPKL